VNTDNVDITIDHSLFFANSADDDGGALEVSGGDSDLVVTDSVFEENDTVGGINGGAIKSGMFSMTISGSLFLDNESERNGGAIYRDNGSDVMDEITSSDFVQNESGEDYDGGAIWTDQTTGITNSTFDDNTTGIDGLGGAIYSQAFLSVSGSEFDSNYSSYDGGAIYMGGNGDGLTVENSTFTNNESRWEEGGAIYANPNGNDCPTDTCITVRNSVFEYNEAENGGAIYARDSIVIQDSEFIGNDASDDGGAANIGSNAASIKNSIFRDNRAGWGNGGAIEFYGVSSGRLTVQATTFTDNSAGGDYNYGRRKDGGAIASYGILSIAGSTFTGNHSSSDGGAVYAGDSLTVSGSLFSRNRADGLFGGSGGAIYANEFANIETNVMRNNSADQGYGGAVFFDSATQASVFSRNLLDANTAYNGGGVAIFGSAEGSNRMAIHTNRIWNNVASNNGGGLWANFTEAGALYELASNMKSTMFVRNRAIYGAAGLVEVNSVTKANQRIFTSLTKSNKYQLNRSTMRGWDKLMLKLETLK
jgi:predicted outer membrane repeat protein